MLTNPNCSSCWENYARSRGETGRILLTAFMGGKIDRFKLVSSLTLFSLICQSFWYSKRLIRNFGHSASFCAETLQLV